MGGRKCRAGGRQLAKHKARSPKTRVWENTGRTGRRIRLCMGLIAGSATYLGLQAYDSVSWMYLGVMVVVVWMEALFFFSFAG